ncbi:MAG: nucleoside-diphosphate sugar epimerase/dehydratase, partial [Gammaproteobacteria bacterium]
MKLRIKSRTIIFLHDLAMVPVAWMGAYWLRFNLSHIPQLEMNAALTTLPLVMLIQGAVFRYFGLYRGVWHFSSVPDLVRISKSVLAGVLLITAVLFLYCRLEGVPRSTIPLYVCLLLLALCVPRFLYRFWKDRILKVRRGKRTLIVGAGAAGEMLVRDLLRDTDSTYLPIAFLDDDQNKKHREIQGVRVMASVRRMPALIEKLDIEAVLIAVPSATDAQMRRIVEICEQC